MTRQSRHELMTTEEAADMTRLPRRQILELARSGQLPVVKVGRKRMFTAAVVQAFIAKNTDKGGQP